MPFVSSLDASPLGPRQDPLCRCIAAMSDEDHDGELVGHGACLRPAADAARVFDWLRDLTNLARWWPCAKGVQSLPPGVHGVGDVGLLYTDSGVVGFRVLAFRPRRRIVLMLQKPGAMQILDLRVTAESPCRLDLRIEAPRKRGHWRALWQALHLRRQCLRASAALEVQLRQFA